ncbi:hypothetical protein N7478_011829 [Penicillium angulare]|uniref:uncharacterized protein n=1 Tax=Penicillium angulare TaxID=116970 RepID=UPI00254093E1|nr:uncharacterized protein N7478_011829 [Penicillium angulare]KAJ5261234.1 hypothetical protein N7478_011829 [Penicillium angulare]
MYLIRFQDAGELQRAAHLSDPPSTVDGLKPYVTPNTEGDGVQSGPVSVNPPSKPHMCIIRVLLK